jgi:hypothetical protein
LILNKLEGVLRSALRVKKALREEIPRTRS